MARSMYLVTKKYRDTTYGTVLGSLLFNLYIYDSTNFSNSKLYVDDVKIYTELCDSVLFLHLQSYLDHIQSWAADWLLTISESKFPIIFVDSVCELGNIIDSNLCLKNI